MIFISCSDRYVVLILFPDPYESGLNRQSSTLTCRLNDDYISGRSAKDHPVVALHSTLESSLHDHCSKPVDDGVAVYYL